MINRNIFIFSILITILFFIPNIGSYYTINFDLKVSSSKDTQSCQVFYANQNTYREELSKNIPCNFTKNIFKPINIKVYSKTIYPKIRFDLPSKHAHATIKNLNVSFQFLDTPISFQNIKTSSTIMHNIDILNYTSSDISIQAKGDDPYIELSTQTHINNYYKVFLLYIILIFIIIYILLYFLQKMTVEIFFMLVLFAYSTYCIFGMYDIRFHYILPLLTLYMAITNQYFFLPFAKQIISFMLLYLGLASISMFLPVPLANFDYLYQTFPLIIASIILIIGMHKQELNTLFFKKYLTILLLLLAIIMILIHEDYLINMDTFFFEYFTFYTGPWLQKNYMFWYVLLLFGTLSFYNIRDKKDFLIIGLILAFSYFALYHGYSKSAMLAFITSTIVYILLSTIFIKKKYLLIIIWIMTLYIIFSPIIFSLIDLSSYHPRLIHRNEIYHKAAELISQHWFTGYGYGSTLLIDSRNFLQPETIANFRYYMFRGGHPHNLSLLFWLEFGIIGAIFLAYYVHKILLIIVNNTYNTTKMAALLAMFVSLDIISSFSWSIWYPKVLYTFTFFAILLSISLNSKSYKNI